MKREHRFFGENQTQQAVDFIVRNELWGTGYNTAFDLQSMCFVIEWDDGIEELEWNN